MQVNVIKINNNKLVLLCVFTAIAMLAKRR